MTEPLWPARIDLPGTPRRGSGFLVTDRHVLTCAHVVRGHREAFVTLRDSPQQRPAVVIAEGPWWSPSAQDADVAVLELREPVSVTPAEFAPHSAVEIYSGKGLSAFGFPEHHPTGVNSLFTALPNVLIESNVQLVTTDGLGVRLQAGFSGAAVYNVHSGQVFGMIKSASRGDERVGEMVPVSELARHCPQLDEIIGLGSLSPRAYTELRAALRPLRMRPEKIGQLLTSLRSKVHAMPAHLTSLLAIVEALVVETIVVNDAEMHYHLAGLMAHLGTEDTHQWAGAHVWHGELPVPKTDVTHDCAIVVRLEPAATTGGESYELTVWTVTEPDGELCEPVVTRAGLSRAQWKDEVEQALVKARARIPLTAGIVTVEFVLPRRFLAEPVDEWIDHTDDLTPLGISRPVTVRDLDWFSHANPADLSRRATALRAGNVSIGDELQWRDCTKPPGGLVAFKAWLRADGGPYAVGLAGEWTAPEHLGVAVAAGPPVLLWPRQSCLPGKHTDGVECAGLRFRREIREQLRGVTIDAVARRVQTLRGNAAIEEDETHCGSGVTLLHDDARRRPMPLTFAE